ncbi:MAG: mannose-1-phosphate guanylyltransferase/mannose-6-phosphate isomerase [Bdellovibrionota bacterium]
MSSKDVYLGILSGGAGTRLWPVSRKSYPKQFYSLASKDPLLIETLKRVENMGSLHILTTKNLESPSRGLLTRHNIKAEILAEPSPQNTAPVIALFNEICLRKNPNAIICIFPADSFVNTAAAFRENLNAAIALAEKGRVVTFGIKPTHPSTAYGYLKVKEEGSAYEVESFAEKPTEEKAKALIQEGALWNSGTFIFKAAEFKKILTKLAPEIAKPLECLNSDLSNVDEVYKQQPSISIDYAVMEKLSHIACIKASFEWSDLGSWEEVASRSPNPYPITEIKAEGNFYTTSKDSPKTVSFIGTKNIIAVDTPDALLILEKGHGQDVKALVDQLKSNNTKITEDHVFEERPWGRFEILRDTSFFKSKIISVWAGQRLSYQSHKHRMEHWILIEGSGEFTLDDKITPVKAGDHLFIPLGAKHRISNTGKETLSFIEVQLGTYFGEDDIIRYSDDYGRN